MREWQLLFLLLLLAIEIDSKILFSSPCSIDLSFLISSVA